MRVVASRSEDVALCSLRVGEQVFGIETREVREVLGDVIPQRVPLAPAYIAGVSAYRGEVLTAVSLRELLGMEAWHEVGCLVVLEEEGECFGLMVDSVGGVVTLRTEALEANPGGLDARSRMLFGGAYKFEMGLMVRLETRRLGPGYLAESGLF